MQWHSTDKKKPFVRRQGSTRKYSDMLKIMILGFVLPMNLRWLILPSPGMRPEYIGILSHPVRSYDSTYTSPLQLERKKKNKERQIEHSGPKGSNKNQKPKT